MQEEYIDDMNKYAKQVLRYNKIINKNTKEKNEKRKNTNSR